MFKKLISNKKVLLGTLGLLLAAVIALVSLTGAWWNISGDSENDTTNPPVVQQGGIDIVATLSGDPDGAWNILYQPGFHAYWGSATITNSGSIAAFVKVDISAETLLKADGATGKLLADSSSWTTKTDDENITLQIDADALGHAVTGVGHANPGQAVQWFRETENSGSYYLSIPGNTTVVLDECISVLLDGPGMGNDYMHSVITVSLSWQATQILFDAIDDIFGIEDINTLHRYTNDLGVID